VAEGTVKWFNASKSCCFLTPEEGAPDLFVPGSGYRELIEGQRVQFESEQGPRGPQAKSVCPA
jgi:cold shock protein